jgi:hypothetical protein
MCLWCSRWIYRRCFCSGELLLQHTQKVCWQKKVRLVEHRKKGVEKKGVGKKNEKTRRAQPIRLTCLTLTSVWPWPSGDFEGQGQMDEHDNDFIH